MNVNDLHHGQEVLIVYPGIEDHERVTDIDRGRFTGWDDHGINVSIHGFDSHIAWTSRNWVAVPGTFAAVTHPRDENLPTTRAENE